MAIQLAPAIQIRPKTKISITRKVFCRMKWKKKINKAFFSNKKL